jgi:hypothetical protein
MEAQTRFYSQTHHFNDVPHDNGLNHQGSTSIVVAIPPLASIVDTLGTLYTQMGMSHVPNLYWCTLQDGRA